MKLSFFLTFFLTFLCSSLFGIESNTDVFEGTKANIILGKKNESSLEIGLNFSIQKDWKIYWIYPGDAGSPPKLKLLDSEKYENITPSWPFPEEEFDESVDLISRIYKNNIIIPYKILLKKNFQYSNKIRFELEYQICKDICIPVKTNLVLNIPKGNYINQENMAKIQKFKERVPVKLISNSNITITTAKVSDKKILIKFGKIPLLESKNNKIKAILINNDFPNLRSKNVKRTDDGYELTLESKEKIFLNNNKSVIFFKINNNSFFYKSIIKELPGNYSHNKGGILTIFITAFFAGFILNFMPCVLPVLGIKINNLLKQSTTRNHSNVKISSFYVSLGILSMFFMFSIISILLRSIGLNFGWGMQFQSPIFLIILLVLLLIFTLITFDLIKINFFQKYFNINFLNRLANKNNLFISNFTTGILSTLLATPCTAPLVGSAISFALSQNYLLSIPIFIIMGLGKSLPYFIFIIKPNILFYVPKPGIWMKYIKVFIGFMLLISLLWLGKLLLNHYIYFSKNYQTEDAYNKWEDFNKEKLLYYIDNNHKVFVDITAEWCINCKINKNFVLEDQEVQDFFKENNIKLMRADWTFPDIEILNFIKEYNRFGIPFNITFSVDHPEGYIFSEILKKTNLLKVLSD